LSKLMFYLLHRDEVLYQARIHPEQYTNTLPAAQVKALHEKLMYVCNTACDLLADSSKFPEDWLMLHRWDKGRKGGNKLPNGAKIVHLQVGGRTSAVVPSLQKKTGAVAGDVDDGEDESEEEKKPKKSAKRARAKAEEDDEDEEEAEEEEEQPKKKKPVKKAAEKKQAKPEVGRRRSSRRA
jgi:formamidopyrimidine-DNA glycosylase